MVYASPEFRIFNVVAVAVALAASAVLIQLMSSLSRAQLVASHGNVFA